jgi:hypothetical protein
MWSTRARHRVLEAAKSTPAVILRDLRDRALLATLLISSDGSQR